MENRLLPADAFIDALIHAHVSNKFDMQPLLQVQLRTVEKVRLYVSRFITEY